MNNLLAGTGIATVFVDHQLRIRRFTPAATQVVNLIQTDVGRPRGHIVSNLVNYDGLVEDTQAVLDTPISEEVEVQTKADDWYLLNIRPYRTVENVIEGAVLTFFDITEMKGARDALRESEALRRMAVMVRDAHDAITMQDLEGRILAWNLAAEKMFGWVIPPGRVTRPTSIICPGQDGWCVGRVPPARLGGVPWPARVRCRPRDLTRRSVRNLT